jgi:hypothetical protein
MVGFFSFKVMLRALWVKDRIQLWDSYEVTDVVKLKSSLKSFVQLGTEGLQFWNHD